MKAPTKGPIKIPKGGNKKRPAIKPKIAPLVDFLPPPNNCTPLT